MQAIYSRLNKKIAQGWWFAIPWLSSLVIMLPRLLSPNFNFEDDGIILQTAQKVLAGDVHWIFVDYGSRFRPLYWLGFVPLNIIGGKNPFLYYCSNTIILIALSFLIVRLVKDNGGTKLQACLSGFLFTLSSPVIETFYTVSKAEHYQLFWLLLSLLIILWVGQKNLIGKILAFLLTTSAILFALMVKETTIVILPIAFGWLFLTWIFNRRDKSTILFVGKYFLASLIAVTVFIGLEYYFLGGVLSGKGYGSNFTLTPGLMFFMLFAWSGWLLRDFYSGIFCFLMLLLVLPQIRRTVNSRLLLASAIWMCGWIVIFLAWDRVCDYYLLPFSVGFSIFCGILLGDTLGILRKLSTIKKGISLVLLALIALSNLINLFNNYSNAKIQLSMDRQETALMDFLTTSTLDQDRILINFDANNTFFSSGMALIQFVEGRPKINIQPFRFETANPELSPQISYYLITVETQNEPLFSVRGSWGNQKNNQALEGILGPSPKPVFIAQESFRMISFNPINIVCPFVKGGYLEYLYCSYHLPVMDLRPYTYAWQVYRVTSSIQDLDLPAVFGPDGNWEFQLPDGSVKTLHFGQPGDVPLAGDWIGSDQTGIGVFDPAKLTFSLDDNLDSQPDSTFKLHGMTATDIPLAGDWNCDGKDTLGFFRPSDGSWHFWNGEYTGSESLPVLTGTEADVFPLVGDWNKDGCDTIGIYRPQAGEVNLENILTADFSGADFYAPKDAFPVVANWGGIGIDTLAFVLDETWTRLYANCDCPQANLAPVLKFGFTPSIPLAGNWSTGK
jgi:hypothetical protein